MDLKEKFHGVNPSTHWYYCSKRIPLIRFVQKILNQSPSSMTLVDIGAGCGYFSEVLDKKFGDKISKIILVDINYSDEEVKNSQGKRIEKIKFLPQKIENSVLIMMDILEHIEDDKAFLSEIISKTYGTNYFFITVPAYMSLWSYHDKNLFHYRRYTLKGITSLASEKGIKISSNYYLFLALLPIAWVIRKLINRKLENGTDLKKTPAPVNIFLKFVFRVEMSFSKLNKYGGVSCCVEGLIVRN